MKVMARSKLLWPSEDSKTIRYTVHKFRVADAEHPDLHAASALLEWEKSPAGQWAMKNSAPTPSWSKRMTDETWSYTYYIDVYLSPEQLTYYKLKYE